jgi:hypothetical protein
MDVFRKKALLFCGISKTRGEQQTEIRSVDTLQRDAVIFTFGTLRRTIGVL